MKNENYRNLLLDNDIFQEIKDKESLFSDFDSISVCVNSMEQDIKCVKVNIHKKESNKIDIVNFSDFFKECLIKNDLDSWLYVSKDLVHAWILQKDYGFNSCFVNDGVNDDMDISIRHEVSNIGQIQKIKTII